jgi:hypothetical protein
LALGLGLAASQLYQFNSSQDEAEEKSPTSKTSKTS